MQQLAASIQESFALLLQRCSKLVAADGHAEEILEDVLAGAGSLIKELQSLKGAIVPCFPPHYGIMAYVGGEYLAQLDNLIDLVGLASGQLSNGQILKVMCWLQEYQTSLLDLSSAGGGAAGKGNGRMTRDSADVTSGGAALLMDTYLGRVSGTLDSWLKNIVETDFSCEPRQAADGKLWTPGPVDLFRILDEQLSVAAQAGGPLLALVAGEAARTLRSFQQASQARLDKGGQPLEVLCAVANNSQRCQVLGEEFAAAAERLMGTSSAEQIYEVHAACKAFPELGNAAVIGCAHVVFSDPGFGELFGRVACTDAWLTGTVTGSILATLDDFFQDFEQWLQRPLYMRMVERVMEECVSHFLAATLTQLRMVRNEDLTALRRDVTKLTAFFGAMLDEGITTVSCQPLADMCEFLNSDSVEAFVLSYTTLLESAPGITPVLLSNLLTARVASHQDMTKADAKEVSPCGKLSINIYVRRAENVVTNLMVLHAGFGGMPGGIFRRPRTVAGEHANFSSQRPKRNCHWT